MDIFSPPFAPFTIALMVMTMIAALELAGLLFGVAFSGLVDGLFPEMEMDVDADGADISGGDAIGKLFAWLYVGKVPVLIVFATLLAGFGLSGVLLQRFSAAVGGAPLPLVFAAPAALAAALPITRLLGGVIARIMPREETDAVSADSFIGRVATVIRGAARRGAPAEAKLTDSRGLTHYILIEPDEDGAAFHEGAEILVVEKSGAAYRGALNNSPALSISKPGDLNA
ncbi:MAG: YqiJ family protein [Pseudomonadota bacterium]